MKRKFALLGILSLLTLSLQAQQPFHETVYLSSVKAELEKKWPHNRAIHLVFHGHSVPSGYWKTPAVNTLNSYPHLVLEKVKELYPYAVVNVIITAIGGENAEKGQLRMAEVFAHRPDVLFIDYALNDVGLGLDRTRMAWEKMIQEAQEKNTKVILLTPSPDQRKDILGEESPLVLHAEQIGKLAAKYQVGLADPFSVFQKIAHEEGSLAEYMSQVNHPNREGHEIIAREILKYF